MKTNFKRIGKQSISIVLAVMMMLSTMLVGMVTSNAAETWYVIGNDYDTTWNTTGKSSPMSYDSTTGYYYFDKKLDSTSGNHYFRLHNGSNEYGPNTTNDDISISSYNTKFDAVKDKTAKAFKYSCDSLNYRLWFDATTQKIWITDNNAEPTENTYYICGVTGLTGYEWGSNADAIAANKLEYDSATSTYSKTYKNIPKGDYEFKVRDTQNPNIWFGKGNYTITASGCTVSGSDNIKLSLTDTCDVTISISSDNKEMTVTASKDVQTYTIKTETPKYGTIKVSADSLAAGKTFTVEATPDNGYELDAITVTTADGKTVEAIDASTHTYKMPESNVTVSAKFRVKTDARFSVTYTRPTGDGVESASIDPTDYQLLAEGTNVTVTVTVKDGYTASLDVAGATVEKVKDGNTYKFTFSMPAKAITVAPQVTKAGENTDTKIQDLYLIYTTANDGNPTGFTEFLNLYYDSNNQVYAYFEDTEDTKFDTSKTYKFMISTLTGKNSFEGTTNYNKDNYSVNVTTTDDNSIQVGKNEHGYTDNHRYFYGWFSVKNPSQSTVSSVKINLGYYNKTTRVIQENATDTSYTHSYKVIPISGVEGMVQVFAKDGTIRKQIVNNELVNFQKYADMADTVLTAENKADLTKYNNENEYYETAYAKVGTKLKIKTTILPAYRDKYFVKAFSINGYSYGIIDASQANKQEGVYTCEYTIPEDFEGKRIEITPIYYYIDDKDTVTFYVEGFDGKVQEMWGNTIAVQAWYKNGVEGGESGSDTKNALGGYPGQPLVYQGGKYSMQIPKYLNDNTDNTVQGITLNNYFWDDIHKKSFKDQSDKYNCQTYDFNDFYKLSETPDVDNIIFDFRYRTTTDNDPKDNLTNSTYSELELLKDYSGNIVNIFGNILSEDLTADYENNHLTVISNGYVSITGIGKYATEWSVYAPDGTYINKINCSSLINENKVDTDDYTVAYNQLKKYKDLPVMIAYEKSLYGGGDKGTRADGRWYFSKKAQKITANVQIQYGTDVNSEFKDDTFKTDSNEGTETGAKAYFTNAGSSGKTTCEGAVDGGNFSVHAQTDANANYYFLGWYLKTSDGYSFITNESDTDIPMTSNATYVARFIPTPSGTLTLSHTLLTGSADGKTFIKADIIDSEGNVIKPFEETSGNIVIPSSYVNYASKYKIVATLRTEPYGKDEVEGFFNSDQVRYTHVAAGEKTCVVSTTIKDLFDPSSYNLKKSIIPFYSKITSKPLEYTITYTYDTRRDGRQSYVIKDTVSGAELDEMWAQNVAAGRSKEQLSKEFITRKAPFVSNFREVITWNMDAADIKGYTATVLATTDPVKLNISALTVAGSWTAPAPVEYGELALSSNGDYLYKTGTNEFPETFNYSGNTDYAFSFWAIFDNPDAAQKYSDAVKAYMSGTPDQNMSKRLTKLTNLEGYKNLITKSYSKEYNYVSYQNYFIVPVYAGRFAKNEINESQASIRLLEYTRNQWTDDTHGVKGDGTPNVDGSKTDYLYTDFALSFDKDQLLIKDNTDIKVGVAFEIVAKYDPVKPLDFYLTDSNPDEIRNLVKTATVNNKDNGKVGTYKVDSESADRSVYRYQIDNTKISEKNRIEYYLRFKNNKNAQQNVMKVYSYIYDTVSGEVFLSDPEYMNMYDIGNLTYITSGLANINLGPEATV